MDEMRPAITGVANPPGNNMLRNFGHLMNQYSAYVPNASFLFVLFCYCIHLLTSLCRRSAVLWIDERRLLPSSTILMAPMTDDGFSLAGRTTGTCGQR